VGVAVSDVAGWLARPLTIITRRSRREDFAAIARLVEEQEATAVVVGYPLNMDDSIGPQARRVARYAAALQRLRAAGGSRRRRSHLDDAAAAVILQEYLDAQRQAHRQENA
jgi:putative Holliday junction resolvase